MESDSLLGVDINEMGMERSYFMLYYMIIVRLFFMYNTDRVLGNPPIYLVLCILY